MLHKAAFRLAILPTVVILVTMTGFALLSPDRALPTAKVIVRVVAITPFLYAALVFMVDRLIRDGLLSAVRRSERGNED